MTKKLVGVVKGARAPVVARTIPGTIVGPDREYVVLRPQTQACIPGHYAVSRRQLEQGEITLAYRGEFQRYSTDDTTFFAFSAITDDLSLFDSLQKKWDSWHRR